MNKQIIQTDEAPKAIGPYSQAIQAGNMLYISGQIPMNPQTMEIVSGDFKAQARQVFHNLTAIAKAANSSLQHAVKLTVFLKDLNHFSLLNEVMMEFLQPEHYPARSTIEVSRLPRDVEVEIDAVLML